MKKRAFLFLLSACKLLAIEMICPHGCDTNRSIYYNKQCVLQSFLKTVYPAGYCAFHKVNYRAPDYSAQNKFCYTPYFFEEYVIVWEGFPTWSDLKASGVLGSTQVVRSVYDSDLFHRRSSFMRDLEPMPQFDLIDLPGFLTFLAQAEIDSENYIKNETSGMEEIINYLSNGINYFRLLQSQGEALCCRKTAIGAGIEIEQKIEESEAIKKRFKEDLEKFRTTAQNLRIQLNEARDEVLKLHEEQYQWCIQNHRWYGAYYGQGLVNFSKGQLIDALDNIRLFFGALTDEEKNSLAADIYFNKGMIESEVSRYDDAIISLSKAIQKNPDYQEAYFERAIAYYEIGDFDRSLQDYLQSKINIQASAFDEGNLLDFSIGFIKGARNGLCIASREFVPSTLESARGLGHLVWTTIEHPIEASKALCNALTEFYTFVKTCDKEKLKELSRILVPEMYELISNWDQLPYRNRGEIAGFCLGKYGTNILLPLACVKGAKTVNIFYKIKKAEKLCVLQTLASSPESKAVLAQTASRWAEQRATWFAKVELEIEKQGKHIKGHRNFRIDKKRSEWTHPNPETKIKQLAGKGERIQGEVGSAGFRERVDCGEIIGYHVDPTTGEKLPTTMATIHYSKNGAHIVPARPKK